MERIGHYEVGEKLGEGGMGVVYRARDSKLGREVALKVLHPAVANDPERLARLQREAQVLAALNHPNIAQIYGIEGAALVMEFVPGETLKAPVPVDEAMAIARQIADALEAAHEKGIIHRDLKPANIKITPDGKVKVLDFGLAKALSDDSSASGIANSPTLSLAATRAGLILGTAAYMSPEQARGRAVDRRIDVWAFGCVLYEMLTGQQCFSGDTVTDAMAAILTKEPDWSALPPGSPLELLRLCLQKDPKLRLRDIGDAGLIPQAAAPVPVRQSANRNPQSAIAGTLALALVVASIGWWRATRPVPRPLQRFTVDLGADAGGTVNYGLGATAALSPDGRRLVFLAGGPSGTGSLLYSRLLDQPNVMPLAGTENAQAPFFSPDGEWVGFFADGKLKKISVEGGAAVNLCDAIETRGGTWGDNDQIYFVTDPGTSLLQVPAAGGAPQPATGLNQEKGEGALRWPQFLPGTGGQTVIFTVTPPATASRDDATIVVQSLKTGERKTLQRGNYGRYIPGRESLDKGHLVFVRQGTLYAAPMDLRRLELTGPASPVVEDVVSNLGPGTAQFAFSYTGTFVFLMGKTAVANRRLGWLEASGQIQPWPAPLANYLNPRLSPDGKRLAVASLDSSNRDIWVYDIERDTMSRLTFAPEPDNSPVWSPDNKHIAFQSLRSGVANIYWVRADGAGDTVRLTESKNAQTPYSFSPDGKRLAYTENSAETGWDLWTMPLDLSDPDHPKPGKPELFLGTPFLEVSPVFSPDGRWLAYVSTESGQMEVYVRPFPGPGGKWQVSTGGGMMPVWSKNGKDLFYRSPDSRIMVAGYTGGAGAFTSDKPRVWSDRRLIDTGANLNFDLAPDGKRFVVMLLSQAAGDKPAFHWNVLLNFPDELQRKAK